MAWVSYSSLPNSPYYELAKKYFPRGAGSVFTFGVKGGVEMGMKVVERTQLWSHLANIGGRETCRFHTATKTTSHSWFCIDLLSLLRLTWISCLLCLFASLLRYIKKGSAFPEKSLYTPEIYFLLML